MIELGVRKLEWFTYEEAIMYCFCLGDGWRLPVKEDMRMLLDKEKEFFGCWFHGQPHHPYKRLILPVRDIND